MACSVLYFVKCLILFFFFLEILLMNAKCLDHIIINMSVCKQKHSYTYQLVVSYTCQVFHLSLDQIGLTNWLQSYSRQFGPLCLPYDIIKALPKPQKKTYTLQVTGWLTVTPSVLHVRKQQEEDRRSRRAKHALQKCCLVISTLAFVALTPLPIGDATTDSFYLGIIYP